MKVQNPTGASAIQNTKASNADEAGYGSLVEERLHYEVQPMDDELVVNEDMALLEAIQFGLDSRAMSLLALMFRLRIQSAIFDVYTTLWDHHLLELKSLQYNVELHETESEVYKVAMAFVNAFEFGDTLNDCPLVALTGCYIAPLIWLAGMIVQGSIVDNLDPFMDSIARKGTFGAFNVDKYRKCWPKGLKLQKKPTALAIPLRKQGHIGVYLPMGLSIPFTSDDVYNVFVNEVKKLEALFASYFELSEHRDSCRVESRVPVSLDIGRILDKAEVGSSEE